MGAGAHTGPHGAPQAAVPAGPRRPDELLAEVIDALSEALAVFDENGLLITSNAGFRKVNAPIADLVSPGVAWDVLLREALARGMITPQIHDRLVWMEARLEDADRPVPSLEHVTPAGSVLEVGLMPTANGGFIITQKDITARRRYEEAEREADVLLRKVLEACPANVVMSRVGDGHILYRSPAATELLGTALNSREHFASREERADFITALLPEGRVDDMAVMGVRPDGSHFPCLISARLIDYRGDEVIVSSTVDVSKEIALRKTLSEQREQIFLAEKMSALGELLAGVAHELNNPLSVVVGHSLMMREEASDPEVLRRIEKISDAAERCAKIVKSFLAMARQQPVRLAPVDMRETIATAAEVLEQSADSLARMIVIDLPDRFPPVQGDAQQISQVIYNLVTNAHQAIRESGTGDKIRITARHDPEADVVEFRVSDNGPGVPKEIRSRIFDPLFTTKEVGKGTGIGLAFCHRVITAHAGEIRLLPGDGGATFAVRLPVARASAQAHGETPDATTGGVRGRALVVDDEPEVAELIREILAREGFAVDSAASGEDALSLVRAHTYTAIFTDLNMPGIGGRGFHDAVAREMPEVAARIAFVTGDTMSPQVRAFLDVSRRRYIEKPIAPRELRDLVHRMMGERTTEGAS
jgi:signal transduction histidine kinase/ActR/RegA family two-component response regulator